MQWPSLPNIAGSSRSKKVRFLPDSEPNPGVRGLSYGVGDLKQMAKGGKGRQTWEPAITAFLFKKVINK